MKVLYVEDNPANVFLVKRVARMGNHEIINYIDGGQALKKYDEINPDLVLMDIQLAGDKSGLDVVRELRARGVKTTIIAVTAYAMVGDKERCIEAGCDDYLAKPLPIPRLVEIFETHSKRVAQQAPQVAPAAVAVAEAPKPETPTIAAASEAPKVETVTAPVAEAPKVETPVVAPVTEASKAETPALVEAPKTEAPDAPGTEAPKAETPAVPVVEASKAEPAPVASPVTEAPKAETPAVEKLRTPTAPLVDPAPDASAAKTGEEAKATDNGKKEETSAKPETSSQG